MAVEGHHLRFLPCQILTNREIISGVDRDQSFGFYNMQLGFVAPAAATSVSDLAYNNLPSGATGSRERPRDSDCRLHFPGVDLASLLQQQMLDVDRHVLRHVEKVKAELTERMQRCLGRDLATVEHGLLKRLSAKEEEIDRANKLNWALQERIKNLSVENQMWRELARSNEAAVHVLRANLEQALAEMQVKAKAAAAGAADDAESCCCGADNAEEEHDDEEVKRDVGSGARRVLCRWCQEREPAVLLLPCRHLCLCAACGHAAAACPICDCVKNGSVLVNLS